MDDESVSLLPCPFCSGDPMLGRNTSGGHWQVRCQGCRSLTGLYSSADAASEAWNRRVPMLPTRKMTRGIFADTVVADTPDPDRFYAEPTTDGGFVRDRSRADRMFCITRSYEDAESIAAAMNGASARPVADAESERFRLAAELESSPCILPAAHLSGSVFGVAPAAPVAQSPCAECGAVVDGNVTRYFDAPEVAPSDRCTVPVATAAEYDSRPYGEALPCSAHPVAAPSIAESDDSYRARLIEVYGRWGALASEISEGNGAELDDCGKILGVPRGPSV